MTAHATATRWIIVGTMRTRSIHRCRNATPKLALALMLAILLGGCGSARVVRQPGTDHAAGPVRVSAPKYGATATVNRGDTLYGIATRNGISALDLAVWNDVPPPYTIYPGQRLRLYPSTRPPKSSTTSAVPRRPAATRPRWNGCWPARGSSWDWTSCRCWRRISRRRWPARRGPGRAARSWR